MSLLLLLLNFLPKLLCQEFPVIVNINNGVANCSGFDECKVNCDYGFISNGTYTTSLENLESTY